MLSQARLKTLIHYNPYSGAFTWRDTNRAHKCKIAGTKRGVGGRYRAIQVDGKEYYAHRLAFLYMEGEFPPSQVDHINAIRHDNRWLNLRHATPLTNQHYRRARERAQADLSMCP